MRWFSKPNHSELASMARKDLEAAGVSPVVVVQLIELVLKVGKIAMPAVYAIIKAIKDAKKA